MKTGAMCSLFGIVLSTLALMALPANAASPFADWTALVVAGDWHASNGKPTEAFDNARRDVAKRLIQNGFSPSNLRQFSVRPERYTSPRPAGATRENLSTALGELARGGGKAGCLFYLTSHGSPQGALLGAGLLTPDQLSRIIDDNCPARPTIVVISTCYSGVFVPTLAGSNRMILTAARADRTSFGCGEDNIYPFFDDCFLGSHSKARSFGDIPSLVRACVSAKEKELGVDTPSEPQVKIGANLAMQLPLWRFTDR